MSNALRTLSLIAAVALAAATLPATTASAGEPAPVHGTKTVGAMAFETYGRTVGPADIVRQGGFVAASMARWTRTPGTALHASAF